MSTDRHPSTRSRAFVARLIDRRPPPARRRCAIASLLLAALCFLGGCSNLNPQKWRTIPEAFSVFKSAGGDLEVNSLRQQDVILKGGFEHGIYTMVDKNTVTAVLYDGELENPRQAVTIRMFWNPRAGRTPVDPTATNAVMQYIIFTGEPDNQVGIYSGAGYLYPNTTVGNEKLTAGVWQSTLRLADASDGFHDRLGQAHMRGKFTVRRDDLAMQQVLRSLGTLVHERLGRPRLVDGEGRWVPWVSESASLPVLTRNDEADDSANSTGR